MLNSVPCVIKQGVSVVVVRKKIVGMYAAASAGIVPVVAAAYLFMCQPYRPHCIIDSSLSDDAHQAVQEYIADACSHTLSLSKLLQDVAKEHPFIFDIHTKLNANGMVTLQIKAEKPYVRINDTLVMTERGRLIKSSFFANAVLEGCSSMRVSGDVLSDQHACHYLRMWLTNVPCALLANFDLYWMNRHTIYGNDRTNRSLYLVCSDSVFPDLSIDRAYHAVKKSLIEQEKLGSRSTKQWLIDVRFVRQIIVSAREGGPCYGTPVK